MEFIIDNPETEKIYQQILREIPPMQNGITADNMKARGIVYEKNWGVSIVDLKKYATQFEQNHLLALKLWNKKWRETMILATMLENSDEITEEQMDFWLKTSGNIEIVEQAVLNVFPKSPYAFAKALEWCRGKKYAVKYAGLLMMGRMALANKDDIDEMFESFFEVILPLAKDPSLHDIFYRSMCQLARRNKNIHPQCVNFVKQLKELDEENTQKLSNEILEEIDSIYFIDLIKD